MGEKRRADDDSGSDKKPKSSKKEKKEKKEKNDLDPDEAAAKAERKAAKKAKRDESGGGGGGGEDEGEDAIETVEVECKGQTGRIIGKGGSKIREIEDLTGCILSIDQAKGICTIRGPTVAPAVQEVKNIVQEGRERDEVAHAPAPPRARSQSQGWDDAAHDRRPSEPAGVSTPDELPFGKPPAGSASRNDTGQNDWQCPCGSTNFARRSSCFRCRAPRADGVAGTSAGGNAPVGVGRPHERTTSPASAARTEAGAAARASAQGSDANGYEVFIKYLPHTSEGARGCGLLLAVWGDPGRRPAHPQPHHGPVQGCRVCHFCARARQAGCAGQGRHKVRGASPQHHGRQDGDVRREGHGAGFRHAHPRNAAGDD